MTSAFRLTAALVLPVVSLTLLPVAVQAAPQWIWSSKEPGDRDVVWTRAVVDVPELKGVRVQVSCDNICEVWINGSPAGKSNEWAEPPRINAAQLLKPGKNVILFTAHGPGGSSLPVKVTVIRL